MSLIDKIKQTYPDPKRVRGDDPLYGSYCVGGAICLYLRDHEQVFSYDAASYGRAFPRVHILADALGTGNPDLSYNKAAYYADKIIDLNDAGNFEQAYQFAGEALEYRKKGESS